MADWADLRTRTLSAVVLVAVALTLTLAHPLAFSAMVLVAGVILLKEYAALTRNRSAAWQLFGPLYIIAALIALIYLRHANLNILLATIAIVCTGDIAAYLVGKQWGKHKIAPTISPGKSWEGLAGSIIASAAVGAALGHMAPIPHAVLGALIAIIGLGGDLFESALKRRAGVKDSGRLIPGHGGLFDRVDALLPCAIFSAAALYIRLGVQ
jgi:phosphatidate cytidylyltransferase